jgi:hypothetical protein
MACSESIRTGIVASAAAKIRAQSFTLDGEAVVCGEEAWRSLTPCAATARCGRPSCMHSICWSWTERTCGRCRSASARTAWRGCWRACGLGSPSTSTPTRRRHGVPARLQDGPGGDRLKAPDRALPVGPFPGLAQDQEPRQSGDGKTSGGAMVGQLDSTAKPVARWRFAFMH